MPGSSSGSQQRGEAEPGSGRFRRRSFSEMFIGML
jgi:hypothetical protein